MRLSGDNLFVYLNRLISEERWESSAHFKNKNAQRPVIYRLIVTLTQNDFGRQVLRGSTKGPSTTLTFLWRFFLEYDKITLNSLGKTEIRNLEVTGLVDQDVFRFQISVDYIEIVKVLESVKNLSSVESPVCFARVKS